MPLFVYKAPVESTKTTVVPVEDSILKQILPAGIATECNTNEATCGQFDQETHSVTRGENGRISLTESRVGTCELTGKPCLRVAKRLETAIKVERE